MFYEQRKTDADVLICEGACVVGDVDLAPGVSVWYNAVLRGDEGAISVGRETNLQDGVILHANTVVGQGCTVGHGGHSAWLHGGGPCSDRAWLHRAGRRQNRGSLHRGRRRLVTGKMDAPAGSMILGSPAKVVRR